MATIRVSALGLAARYSDAPKSPAVGVAVSPIILARSSLAEAATGIDDSLELTGAQSAAQAGNIGVDTSAADVNVGVVGPWILPSARRNVVVPDTNIEITLTGAEVDAQAESLEGASVSIILDGATVFADPGTVVARVPILSRYYKVLAETDDYAVEADVDTHVVARETDDYTVESESNDYVVLEELDEDELL